MSSCEISSAAAPVWIAGTSCSVQILSKVDAGANSIFNWAGTLAAGSSVTLSLPAITSYSVGNHTFTATTGTVNGATDANGGNNASSTNFSYTNCSNEDETINDSPATAPLLALNTPKNGQIGAANDIDYYKITTTTASPKLKITLTNLPADYEQRPWLRGAASDRGASRARSR